MKYNFDRVTEILSEKGCTLIEKRDYTATEKIPYICPVGHRSSAVIDGFASRRYSCRYCYLGWKSDDENVKINRSEDEYLIGLLLGDGNISLVNLAKYKHSDIHREYVEKFLPSILPSFEWRDVRVEPERDKIFNGQIAHAKESYSIVSRSYNRPLVALHNKWYNDEPPRGHHAVGKLKKHVPDDIHLPYRALSTWYEGDGSLELSKSGGRSLSIHLATNGFCSRCLTTLREKMYEEHEMLLTITKDRRMTLCDQRVNEFLDKIYPFRSSSYGYKYTAFEKWSPSRLYPLWHPTLKTCTQCWTEYPKDSENESDYFVKHSGRLYSACKTCKQEIDRSRRKKHA